MQAVKGYIEDGKVIPLDTRLPNGNKAIIIILDELFSLSDERERKVAAFRRFREELKELEPLPPEFDEAIARDR